MWGLLFDLDGTLALTNAWHEVAWREALQAFGVSLSPEGYANEISGRSNVEIVGRLLPHLHLEDAARVWDTKEARFREMAKGLVAPTGLHELVTWALAERMRLGVVTNAPRANATHVIADLGLQHTFEWCALTGRGLFVGDAVVFGAILRMPAGRFGEPIIDDQRQQAHRHAVIVQRMHNFELSIGQTPPRIDMKAVNGPFGHPIKPPGRAVRQSRTKVRGVCVSALGQGVQRLFQRGSVVLIDIESGQIIAPCCAAVDDCPKHDRRFLTIFHGRFPLSIG